MRWLALAHHIGRLVVWSAVLVAVLVMLPEWPHALLAAIPAAFVYFAAFALFHDCAHGALGLPTRTNDVVLFLTSGPLFLSAHGQRQLHLRHHARPFAADDMEGEGALTSLPVAALTAPMASFRMRWHSYVACNERVRPWVVVENALNAAVVVAVIMTAHRGELVAAGTMFGLQLTMNAWASHIPHRAPRWLIAIASRFEWTHSPVVLSLVYHLEHHAHPRLACMDLKPNLDVRECPLLIEAAAQPVPLAWAQLQVEARPRPRMRGLA